MSLPIDMEYGLTKTNVVIDNEVLRTSDDTVDAETAELDKEQIRVKKYEAVEGTTPETPARHWGD